MTDRQQAALPDASQPGTKSEGRSAPTILASLPAEGGEAVSKWGPARNLFVSAAEKFMNATRYEEASAIADGFARDMDTLYATPTPQGASVVVPREPTETEISAAATAWCGQKDRETFMDDVIYFKANWRSLPGLRAYVERAMIAPAPAPSPSEGAVVGELVEQLAWYGEQARLARLIHSEGDAGRSALAADGGKRAQAAIARTEAATVRPTGGA